MLEKVEGGMEEAPREGRRVPRDTESEGFEKPGGVPAKPRTLFDRVEGAKKWGDEISVLIVGRMTVLVETKRSIA